MRFMMRALRSAARCQPTVTSSAMEHAQCQTDVTLPSLDDPRRPRSPGKNLAHSTLDRRHTIEIQGRGKTSGGVHDDDVTYTTLDVRHIDDITSTPPQHRSKDGAQPPAGGCDQDDAKPFPSPQRHTSDVRKNSHVIKVLPPCRVCGSQASGFHYGCNTCEACKGFFRRALVRNDSFRCKGGGRCSVKGDKRSLCASCRYQRCLALGMSKDAIKTGRYTHEKRTRDTLEVRELESSPESFQEENGTAKMLKEEELTAKITLAARQTAFLSTSRRTLQDIIHLRVAKGNGFLTNGELFLQQNGPGIALELPQTRSSAIDLTKRANTSGFQLGARQKSTSQPLHATEVQRLVSNYAQFGRSLPGFPSLCAADQTTLLSSAWLEVSLLGNGFSDESFPDPTVASSQKLYPNDHDSTGFHDKLSCIIKQLRQLTLTSAELALTQAMCLTFTDRGHLVNRAGVEDVHWLVVTCLFKTLTRNHGSGAGQKFSEIISMVTGLRDISHAIDGFRNS